MDQDLLRRIPSVDSLLARPAQQELIAHHPRDLVVRAVRAALADLRETLGRAPSEDHLSPTAIDSAVQAKLAARLAPSLVPVINATGVVLHTNLGRAPLSSAALGAIRETCEGYSNLEFDLVEGRRGSRHTHLEDLFVEHTGAEASLVVNNNAAAVLLILATLGAGREVIVSRGEIIEIGGSFRLPDVMAAGGARLVEVGTTNRTRLADYEAAIGPETAMLFKAHRSNYAIVGFTAEPTRAELVELGRRHRLPVVEDLGAGSLTDLASLGIDEAVSVARPIREGVDLLCFSGDKLLGGPQCGVILGRATLLADLRRHPLYRALRVDKMTTAALEATVREVHEGRAAESLPVLRAIASDQTELHARAERLAARIAALGHEGLEVGLAHGHSKVGGGSLPQTELPTWRVVLRVAGLSAAELDRRLRASRPAVVSLVGSGAVQWDLRTIGEEDHEALTEALAGALG